MLSNVITCLDDLCANNSSLNISRQIHIGDKIVQQFQPKPTSNLGFRGLVIKRKPWCLANKTNTF